MHGLRAVVRRGEEGVLKVGCHQLLPVVTPLAELSSADSICKMASNAWEGGSIFVPVKVFLAVSPRTPTGPKFQALHAQDNFVSTFKFRGEYPFPLSSLYCRASDRRVVSDLERALVEGRSMTAYLNLQDFQGTILSCHISLIAGGGVQTLEPATSTLVYGRFTVLTIRSASVVGNCCAIGLMVSEQPRAPSALLEARIGVGRPAEAAEVPVVEEPAADQPQASAACAVSESDDGGTSPDSNGRDSADNPSERHISV